MTTEEKYQEIVNNRAAEAGAKSDPKPEEDKTKSGVKVDPPAEQGPDSTPSDPNKGKGEGGKVPEAPKEPTLEDKMQHAMAEMRIKHSREMKSLKGENAKLLKELEALKPKPVAKTLKDFDGDEQKYSEHLRATFKEEILEEVRKEQQEGKQGEEERKAFTDKLTRDLDGIQQGLAAKVLGDLNNPESEMSVIITDERAKPIAEAIRESHRGADMLALMQAKPEIFRQMLELPPRKMEYRLNQLEDSIDNMYKALEAKKAEEKQKKERAESVPTPGNFGNNGNGNDGISGLSTAARVNRYKEEILKSRTTH